MLYYILARQIAQLFLIVPAVMIAAIYYSSKISPAAI
jgi:hypothetical protein